MIGGFVVQGSEPAGILGGAYTAIVRGKNGATGIALIEAFKVR